MKTFCTILVGLFFFYNISAADIVINEFMANPAFVLDSKGEFVEILNAGKDTVDISAWELRDYGSNTFTFPESLKILPGEILTFSRSIDPLINGGFTGDFVLNGFTMTNTADEVLLYDQNGSLIDSVTYTKNALPIAAGKSYQRCSDTGDWVLSSTYYNDKDQGSPGMPNLTCLIEPSLKLLSLEYLGCLPNDGYGDFEITYELEGLEQIVLIADTSFVHQAGNYTLNLFDLMIDSFFYVETAEGLRDSIAFPESRPCLTFDELQINEVDYDQPGVDYRDFIEILNKSDRELSLDDIKLELLNGEAKAIYKAISLAGQSVHANGMFTVCFSDSLVCDLTVSGALQNGPNDGITLLHENVVIDSLIYESANSSLIDRGTEANVGISRISNQWELACLTPGESNMSIADCQPFEIKKITIEDKGNCDQNGWFTVAVSITSIGNIQSNQAYVFGQLVTIDAPEQTFQFRLNSANAPFPLVAIDSNGQELYEANSNILAPSACGFQEGIYLNEIEYDEPGADADYIELLNSSDQSIEIAGYQLRLWNQGAVYAELDLPHVTLSPGEIMVIGMGNETFTYSLPKALQNGPNDGLSLYFGDVLVDSFLYEVNESHLVDDGLQEGVSLSKVKDGWRLSCQSPGENNESDLASCTPFEIEALNVLQIGECDSETGKFILTIEVQSNATSKQLIKVFGERKEIKSPHQVLSFELQALGQGLPLVVYDENGARLFDAESQISAPAECFFQEGLYLNEIEYDEPGADFDYIELVNRSENALSTDRYSLRLINQGANYGEVQLPAVMLDPGKTVVFGFGHDSFEFNFSQALQNGPNDAVQLIFNNELVDEVSYETNENNIDSGESEGVGLSYFDGQWGLACHSPGQINIESLKECIQFVIEDVKVWNVSGCDPSDNTFDVVLKLITKNLYENELILVNGIEISVKQEGQEVVLKNLQTNGSKLGIEVKDRSGNLLWSKDGIIQSPYPCKPIYGLRLNEINVDDPGTDTKEFIELINESQSDLDLNGYSVELLNGKDLSSYKTIQIDFESKVLKPNELFTIGFSTEFEYDLVTSGSIQNGPDMIILKSFGNEIDRVEYDVDDDPSNEFDLGRSRFGKEWKVACLTLNQPNEIDFEYCKPCSISAIDIVEVSSCDPLKNSTFAFNFTLNGENLPEDLEIESSLGKAVLLENQTFRIENLVANGKPLDLKVWLKTNPKCLFSLKNALLAPVSCKPNNLLKINEISYVGEEFIELNSQSSVELVLRGFELRLINGKNGSVYYRQDLDEFVTLKKGGLLTIGTNSSDIRLTKPIQNGPDVVALYSFGVLVDALNYGEEVEGFEKYHINKVDKSGETDYSISKIGDSWMRVCPTKGKPNSLDSISCQPCKITSGLAPQQDSCDTIDQFTQPLILDVFNQPKGGFWVENQYFDAIDDVQVNLSLNASTVKVHFDQDPNCTYSIDIVPPKSFKVIELFTDVNNVSCFGASTGSISISSSEAVDQFDWGYNRFQEISQSHLIMDSLPADLYAIPIRSKNSCWQRDLLVNVEQPVAALFAESTVTEDYCTKAEGQISLSVSGGTKPYQVMMNSVPRKDMFFDQLHYGEYNFEVRDSLECALELTETLKQFDPLLVSFEIDSVSQNGGHDGKVLAKVSGGTAPYDMDWSHSKLVKGTSLSGLKAGNYGLAVIDKHGCEVKKSFYVNHPLNLAPVATFDSLTIFGGFQAEANLLENDVDLNGHDLSLKVLSAAPGLQWGSDGMVSISGDTMPIIVYEVCDNGVPILCSEGKLFIERREVNALLIKTFPNPFSRFINIKLPQAPILPFTYQFYDMNGRQLSSGKLNKEENFVNTEIESKGPYLLMVRSSDRKTILKRLVISLNGL